MILLIGESHPLCQHLTRWLVGTLLEDTSHALRSGTQPWNELPQEGPFLYRNPWRSAQQTPENRTQGTRQIIQGWYLHKSLWRDTSGSLNIQRGDARRTIYIDIIYKSFLQLSGPISKHVGPKQQLMHATRSLPRDFLIAQKSQVNCLALWWGPESLKNVLWQQVTWLVNFFEARYSSLTNSSNRWRTQSDQLKKNDLSAGMSCLSTLSTGRLSRAAVNQEIHDMILIPLCQWEQPRDITPVGSGRTLG